jgi:PhnB protein
MVPDFNRFAGPQLRLFGPKGEYVYIPEGFGTMFPYVFANDAERLITFLKNAFGAREMGRTTRENQIANARIRIGNTTFMISDAGEQIQPSQSAFYLYVENADEVYAKAVACGASGMFTPVEMPYGDKQGGITDPSGNIWWISQRLVDTPYDRVS